MSYRISWPDNTFLAEFSGRISALEVESVNHAFSGDARRDNVRYQIWDLSRVTSYEVPEHEIVYAAAFDKGVTAVRSNLRGAMVASDEQIRERIEKYLAVAKELDIGWDK